MLHSNNKNDYFISALKILYLAFSSDLGSLIFDFTEHALVHDKFVSKINLKTVYHFLFSLYSQL